MSKLTAFRVFGHIIEEMHYSKVLYIDESKFSSEKEIFSAINEIAMEDWHSGEEWEQEPGDIYEGFTINSVKKIN